MDFGPNRMNSQGGIVQPQPTFLSRFCVKFLEVAGAGLASAACAYVLGQTGALQPAPSPTAVAQVAAVSQVSPAQMSPAQVTPAPAAAANEETARMAREDHALLMELARKKDAPPKPEAAPAPQAAAAPKAPKPVAVAQQPRRVQKPEQVVEARPRAAEPLPILPSTTVAGGTPRILSTPTVPMVPPPAADAALPRDPSAAPAPNAAEADRPLFARLKLVPSWLPSSNERTNDRPVTNDRPLADVPRPLADVPRPPMPVGEPLRNMM